MDECNTEADSTGVKDKRKKRCEYAKNYIALRRKNESQEERQQRLAEKRAYSKRKWDSMTTTDRNRLLDKQAEKRRNETDEQRHKRLYNKRLSYKKGLSILSEDELMKKKAKSRDIMAKTRQNASEEQKQRSRENNRDMKRIYAPYYEREASKRWQASIIFGDAVHFKLLPKHSDFKTDTGHQPFVGYLMRNKLMFNHDPMHALFCELISTVQKREFRRKFGVMENYKYIYSYEIYMEKVRNGSYIVTV
jgi:hypothetical protein